MSLGSSIILQWGSRYKTSGGDGWETITFPTPFPSAVFVVTTGMENGGEDTNDAHGYVKAKTLTTINFQLGVFGSTSDQRRTFWMAVGF